MGLSLNSLEGEVSWLSIGSRQARLYIFYLCPWLRVWCVWPLSFLASSPLHDRLWPRIHCEPKQSLGWPKLIPFYYSIRMKLEQMCLFESSFLGSSVPSPCQGWTTGEHETDKGPLSWSINLSGVKTVTKGIKKQFVMGWRHSVTCQRHSGETEAQRGGRCSDRGESELFTGPQESIQSQCFLSYTALNMQSVLKWGWSRCL